MRRVFFVFLLSASLSATDHQECPKLYQSLWPDFCYTHLLEPDACSEITPLKDLVYHYCDDGDNAVFFPSLSLVTVDHFHLMECQELISYLPNLQKPCSYVFCNTCKKPVRKALGTYSSEWDDFVMHHECDDLLLSLKITSEKNYQIPKDKHWCACKNSSIPFAYFNKFTSKYCLFLKHHLQYSKENPSCQCYWPYISSVACAISNLIHDKMHELFQNTYLFNLRTLPKNWIYFKIFPCEEDALIDTESLLRTLQNYFIFCFFYSNYHSVITDLCSYVDDNSPIPSNEIEQLYATLTSIRPLFLSLYSNCLEKHPHPKIYYERGMVHFHEGNIYASLCDMKNFLNSADRAELDSLLTSDFYLQEGTSYAELGQYDKAFEALTKSISKNPENKEAYFERAAVYFETGDFDLSIKDYLESNFKPTPIDLTDLSTIEFSKYLISGILKGTDEAVTNFIPSLLDSANGLSHGLWALVCDPANCSKEMVDSCKGVLEFISSSAGIEVLKAFIPEIKDFNNSQSSEEKATLLGFIIGKYGTEIFAPAGVIKVYKNLQSANRLLTLDRLTKTSSESSLLKEASTKWNKAHLESMEKFKAGEEILKSFKGQFLTETTARKIIHQAGFPTFARPKGIPDNFRVMLSDTGCGMKYVHPKHTHESIRVMPGKPHSIQPSQHKPYVIHKRDGGALDKFGNRVAKESSEAHIPLEEFFYKE